MLKVYTLDNHEEWDEIVKSFKQHDVYYLSGYTKAFYLHGDGQPLLFYYEDSNIKAINVVMKRDVSKDTHFINKLEPNKYYDFTTPYGYGGWLIEGEGSIDNLINEYKTWCKENSIISEVIRFHPIIANQERIRDVYDIMDLSKTISIDLTSEEEIWNNFSSKNRNVIRKAIKNNVTINKGLNKELMNSFVEIYNQTMNRDNADNYYYFKEEFYESILNDLKDNAEVYYAEYENKIIAASIILKENDKLSYHLSGSLREYGSLAPTNLLLYEVSKWGAQNGYKSFHLGGGVGSKEDNLYSFKKAFYKGDGFQYSIGRMIFNEELYNELVDKRKGEELRQNFFPLYRA
ncbi:MAG: GNAT family N-acetyltransferase [Erysipelotrichaceae bacterium]|nr:GNAT family N-acetyltransferase [Erysipelotrichaceae bacterium]